MNLYTFVMIADAQHRHARSAWPDAPTVPERPPRHLAGLTTTRTLAARLLRRLADRAEPVGAAVTADRPGTGAA